MNSRCLPGPHPGTLPDGWTLLLQAHVPVSEGPAHFRSGLLAQVAFHCVAGSHELAILAPSDTLPDGSTSQLQAHDPVRARPAHLHGALQVSSSSTLCVPLEGQVFSLPAHRHSASLQAIDWPSAFAGPCSTNSEADSSMPHPIGRALLPRLQPWPLWYLAQPLHTASSWHLHGGSLPCPWNCTREPPPPPPQLARSLRATPVLRGPCPQA